MSSVTTIPIASLLLGFIPVLLLIVIMRAWGLNALHAMYANIRMLVQLLLIGYVLGEYFDANPGPHLHVATSHTLQMLSKEFGANEFQIRTGVSRETIGLKPRYL